MGVVPFENSSNGSVVFTLDDLADRDGRYSDIAVNGEVYVKVHHFLLGHAKTASATTIDQTEGECGTSTPTISVPKPSQPRSKPLSDLSHITRIYSHPQAFGQCRAFISTYLKNAEIFDVSSTSRAAEIVSQDATGTWAAISSELAGGLYKLDALGKNIEDRDDNTTRFLILGSQHSIPKECKLFADYNRNLTGSKSLVTFTVPHSSPGALADVLGCFREFQLNLTSINSRPSLRIPFQYIFFVEFEGHRLEDPEGSVNGALDRISQVAETWRWLGSWKIKA